MSVIKKDFLILLTKIGVEAHHFPLLERSLEIKKLFFDKTNKSIILVVKQITILPLPVFLHFLDKTAKSSLPLVVSWHKQLIWNDAITKVQDYLVFYYRQTLPAEMSFTDWEVTVNTDNTLQIKTAHNPHVFLKHKTTVLQKLNEQSGIAVNDLVFLALSSNKTAFPKMDRAIVEEQQQIQQQIQEVNKNHSPHKIIGKVLSVKEKVYLDHHKFEILLETPTRTVFVFLEKKVQETDAYVFPPNSWFAFYGQFQDAKNEKFQTDRFLPEQPLFKRHDQAKSKRVELHTHTKMSALDGVGDIADYLTYVNHWNHPAIAITDHQNVHVFPECEKLNKQYPNLKIIFGCEFDFLSEDGWAINKLITGNIAKQKLVFFDIETTGLSVYFDNIIEFAALVVQDGHIIKRETFLIQGAKNIPKNICELTKISQAEYQSKAIPMSEALAKIQAIFQNNILVAHNINFDIDFINAALTKAGFAELDNPLIDTLNVLRFLQPKLKLYKLNSGAKFYKLPYTKFLAHRAIYDTEVVKNLFDAFLNVHKIDDLQQFWKMNNDDKIRSKLFPKHINVLVKNQKGLKDLYHLVSLTHTKTLYREPVLEKSVLEQYRDNFFVGSGCYNGEVFNNACFASDEKLLNSLKFYDYIEIQPLEVYQHLVQKEFISKANLKKAVLRIIMAAKKLNKIIVATGDVHYLEPEHRLHRDIFIFNKQLGGRYHHLYDFKKRIKQTPPQHLRTTDEMLEAFRFLDPATAWEIVVTNTNLIADQIEKVRCFPKEFVMPVIDDAKKILKTVSYQKLSSKYGPKPDLLLQKRFDKELQQIQESGYSTIYLISYYLTEYSLKKGHLFGSRGSVGSSFLAYCLDITEVNPLRPHYHCSKCFHFEWNNNSKYSSGFDLPNKACPKCALALVKNGHEIAFESFLGIDSDTIPDIDLNFSGLFQQEAQKFVFDLLTEKIGNNKIFWTGTVSTVASKTAYGYYKSYLENRELNDLRPYPEIQKIIHYCLGVKKTTGQHPGGLMIIPNDYDVLEFTPYNFPSNNKETEILTTHFDYHVLQNQLLKIDILGHDDPTGLKLLQDMTGVDPQSIDLGDPKIIALFSDVTVLGISKPKANSHFKNGVLGIPEFGTKFVSRMLNDIQVKSFAHLIAVSGLSHGKNVWENNAKSLIEQNKFTLDQVISCRDDILLFLIQNGLNKRFAYNIMKRVKKGLSPSPEQEAKMLAAKIPKWYVESCRKIKYLFPKAHATAYVIMACRFAWFKIHYPHEFYATYFSIRCVVFDLITIMAGAEMIKARYKVLKAREKVWNNRTDQLSTKEKKLLPIYEISLEMCIRGVQLANLDLDLSHASNFIVHKVNDQKVIIPPFIAVDGLGIEVATKIVQERDKKKFKSQEDFKNRTGVNQIVFQILSKLGVFATMRQSNQSRFDFM